jgi:hypothetical protein
MKIYCIYKSKDWKLVFDFENDLVYENGDIKVYKRRESFLYAYKNVSFMETVGLNKELVDALVNSQEPQEYKFLYNRSLDNIERAKKLMQTHEII